MKYKVTIELVDGFFTIEKRELILDDNQLNLLSNQGVINKLTLSAKKAFRELERVRKEVLNERT